jgi:hypothetical protein
MVTNRTAKHSQHILIAHDIGVLSLSAIGTYALA